MTNKLYELLYDRILDITACIHFPLKLFAIYVVIRHTPPPLRHYSFFILNTMIWNFLANFIYVFYHLVPMFPALCYRFDGLSNLFVDSELFGHLIYLLVLLSVIQFGLALCFAFPHRYIVFAHPKLAARIRPAWVFGLCGGVHAALVLFALIYYPIVNGIFSYDDYPNKAELPDRPFVICFDPNGAPTVSFNIAYMIGLIIAFLIIVTSSILFLRKLKKMKNRIVHDATLALQKKVFSSLLTLTAIAVSFYCIPAVLFHCEKMFPNFPYKQETAMVCIVLLANHGSISAIAYLLFFKAYRDAVRRIFSNLVARLRWKSRVRSVVIKSLSSDVTAAGSV